MRAALRRFFRREYAADHLALAYGLAFYLWLCVRTEGTPSTVFVATVSFYPLGLAVGWMYLRNARVPGLDLQTRLGWGMLGSTALALWLIGNTWPYLVSTYGASAYPAWVGVLEIVQHVLLLAALLVFPVRPPASRDRTLAADVGLIVVAGFVLAYHYGARASAAISPASPPEVAFVQSILDWAVFVTAAVGVLYKRDTVTRGAFMWLLAANTLYLSANYQLSRLPAYQLGDAVDGLWFAAWGCRWTAARFAWHRYRAAAFPCPHGAEEPLDHFRGGVFSYVLVAGTFALLVRRVATGDRENLALFVLSATAMAALLLVRQIVELRENRRLFERELAQEARFRSLVQNASDVVLVVDRDGRVSYVSESAERVLGPNAIAAGACLADVLPPDVLGSLASVPDARPPASQRHQCHLRAAGGGTRAVEIVAMDMRADPAVGGIVLNCRDLTERNELERQLHHAQKLDAVGHLAGGLAHDFNNVLTAIQGYAALLRDDLPESARTAADIGQIEQSVDRAVAVTRKLLAFSRRQAVQRSLLNLNTVLGDLRPLLRQLLTDRIDVRVEPGIGLWTIKADLGQMEQVIVNLVTNARDAMPLGGCVRRVTANRTIAAPSAETGDLVAGEYVSLIVSDQGTGMPDDIRERIFEPFFSTKPRERGVGLGLAMVHGIVANSSGRVSVSSTVGHGTTVTILLPRATDGEGDTGGAPPVPAVAGGRG